MKIQRTVITRARLLVVAAFTLVEIMVVMVLLSVIVLGLMVMFTQTQKAFRAGMTQTDQLEGGRMFSELLLRDLEQIQPSGQPTGLNFYTQIPQNYTPLEQSMPASTVPRTNVLQDLFFVTRVNQTWTGVGYFVRVNNNGTNQVGVQTVPDIVGTLYRFETNMPVSLFNGSNAFQQFLVATNGGVGSISKIMDGVVEFSVHCYDTNGILLTQSSRVNFTNNFNSILINDALPTYEPNEEQLYAFSNNLVPAYVEVQLGVLEPDTLKRFNSIPNSTVRSNFLANHAGNVQLFRQRIAIRDVDPSAYQ